MPEKNAASPYATGGGGTRLEHRLATVFLVRLLTGGTVYELAERTPTRVAFQQGPATSVDDLVIDSLAPDGVSAVHLGIAVRRTPKFVRSDKATGELITAFVRADLVAELSLDPLVDCRLAITVSGHQKHAKELSELAVVARAQENAGEFFKLLRTRKKYGQSVCLRLDHLLDMVSMALVSISDREAGTSEHRCWSLLRRLWIMQVDLEAPQEGDWTELVDNLKPVALGHSREAAVALRDRLEQLAAELVRSAAVLDASALRKRLHGEIVSDAHIPPAGWTQLLALDQDARSIIKRSLTGADATALTLPRQMVRENLQHAFITEGDLIVTGDSGVGKSAVMMDAIEPDHIGEDRQAIVINLRYLPDNPLEMLVLLGNSLEKLFAELTAPQRMLVIDAAEAVVEGYREVFSCLIRAARSEGLTVIAIVTSEGLDFANQLMKTESKTPHNFEVPGLDDNELADAATHFPVLRRLVDNSRARELLRRPIVIDLLCRAGDLGLPLNESQALEHIWGHLVRNGGRRDRGAPDAREQVMLQLAAHALRKSDVDELLAALDYEAVDDLRRSDVLLPASTLPWERLPSFKHDVVRTYCVARYFLKARDPVQALLASEAPRWTLPSARLACEIVLSAPYDPASPMTGRFAALQKAFDAIADSGRGKRWSDVPTEALLTVPEPAELLKDAWSTLVDDDATGLARLIRILHGRHKKNGLLDKIISEPLIAQILEAGTPSCVSTEIEELTRNWLRAHVLNSTPAGQPTRMRLLEQILQLCAEAEQRADKQHAIERELLAARTLEEIEEDEDQCRRAAAFECTLGHRSARRQPGPERHRPYLWIRCFQIECLALLGPDLDVRGEAILRRIAEDEPHSLEQAIEPLLAGNSLASYSSKLLIDLSSAYYIEQEYEEDHEGFGEYGSDGIRGHRYHGLCSPLTSYQHGPFVPLFRADYRGGVALLNQMLDHAARCRIRILSNLRDSPTTKDTIKDMKHVLSIAGEPKQFVGDSHVWLWYRGSGVGPGPCTSALQALEFVTEEYIGAGIPPQTLTSLMIESAQNLAMPALALGVLVRHLEVVSTAIDPYLVEPLIWDMESSRTVHEHGGFATLAPELQKPERRSWSLREVSALLALRAEGDRVVQLKALGDRLEAVARAHVPEYLLDGGRQRLAMVRNWARSLDRRSYEVTQEQDKIVIQQVVDPEVEEALHGINAESQRFSDAAGLVLRHVYKRGDSSVSLAVENDVLTADLVLARDLIDDLYQRSELASDGPAAVAASALELYFSSRANVSDDDLIWSTALVFKTASEVTENQNESLDSSLFSQGAEQSAARTLPFLLLPVAHRLRAAKMIREFGDVDALIKLNRAVAVFGCHSTRGAYARALDVIWAEPCNTKLLGRCHHQIVFDIVIESFLNSVLGTWNPEIQRRSIIKLDPPIASSLDSVEGGRIYTQRLTAALRATGSAAISSACCKDDSEQAFASLLDAHQRAMLTRSNGYHHSHSDSLVAARAALWQAIDGDDDTVLEYVRRYLKNSRLLAEGLQAIAVAATERQDAGKHAQRLWPLIMDLVLNAVDADPNILDERVWGSWVESFLIPNPVSKSHYLAIELVGEPFAWRDLLAWHPQIERWLSTITRSRMSIDHLVIAIGELDVATQVDQGLLWIERIATANGQNCAHTFTLPEWLCKRQIDLTNDEQTARWQRIVDLLVVAGDGRVAHLAD